MKTDYFQCCQIFLCHIKLQDVGSSLGNGIADVNVANLILQAICARKLRHCMQRKKERSFT